jgi:hypothetical protein
MTCCLKEWENLGENLEQYQLGNGIVLASAATHYRLPHLSAEIDGNDRPNGFVFTAVSNPVAFNCHFGHGVAIRSNPEPTSRLSGGRSEPAVSAVETVKAAAECRLEVKVRKAQAILLRIQSCMVDGFRAAGRICSSLPSRSARTRESCAGNMMPHLTASTLNRARQHNDTHRRGWLLCRFRWPAGGRRSRLAVNP